MPTTKVLSPLSHFDGTVRLLGRLKAALGSNDFLEMRIAVAYAKSGPLERLEPDFRSWRSRFPHADAQAVFGIDQKGTSIQALRLALELFDKVYIANTPSSSTFHPKMYIFRGPTLGRAILGSHNMTVGGTETNFEAGVELDYSLPGESHDFDGFVSAWAELPTASFSKLLTPALLAQLDGLGLLLDEASAPKSGATKSAAVKSAAGAYPFPLIYSKPPSPLPKTAPSLTKGKIVATKFPVGALAPATRVAAPTGISSKAAPLVVVNPSYNPTSLVIQIVPHHNGEIFLSKIAVNQNPGFFGFPFSGTTTPKSRGTGYPQRLPDPIVDVTIYDEHGAIVLTRLGYGLNTVFYQTKGEIRITVSPDIRNVIRPFSILHLQAMGMPTGADYAFDVYNPGSQRYTALLSACNQSLPSGGGTSRKMGWL